MRHLCSRIPRKVWLAIVLFAVGVFWFGHARLGALRQVPPALDRASAFELPPAVEYTVHDGKVLDGATATSEQQKPDSPGKVDALDMRKAYERASQLAAQTKGKVFKASITPHWFDNNTRFWYRNDFKDGAKEFVLVDADKGTRTAAFDHPKLAAAYSKASSAMAKADRLPFDSIEFADMVKTVRFQLSGATWECDLTSYECKRSAKPMPEESPNAAPRQADIDRDDEAPWARENDDADEAPQQKKKGGKKGGFPPPPAKRAATSPDGKWTAFTKDNNIFLRDKDDKETQLTDLGTAGNPFASLLWAPDSATLVMFRTEPGDKEVYMIETSPKDQLAARLHTRPYPRPGDKFNLHEIHVVDMETKKPLRADVERIDYGGPPRLRWSKDNKHFTFEKIDRGHQRFRVVEVGVRTGKTRNIIDEKADTFIWTAHAPKIDEIAGIYVNYLDATDEILFGSERDGWKHLYLIDAKTGKIKNQITKGEWAIRGIDRVDVKARQIWFRANGKNPGQDPYFVHYYRVNFDGTGLVALRGKKYRG